MYEHLDSDGTHNGIIATVFPWYCPDTYKPCHDHCVCCACERVGDELRYTCIKYGVNLATLTAPGE